MPDRYDGVTEFVKINSNAGSTCKHCSFHIGVDSTGHDRFAESMEHYVDEHGYRLLHVGAETLGNADLGAWHVTVAVLGR